MEMLDTDFDLCFWFEGGGCLPSDGLRKVGCSLRDAFEEVDDGEYPCDAEILAHMSH